MPVPKRKTSKARKGKRRAVISLALPNLTTCHQCHGKKRSHAVCPECGTRGQRK